MLNRNSLSLKLKAIKMKPYKNHIALCCIHMHVRTPVLMRGCRADPRRGHQAGLSGSCACTLPPAIGHPALTARAGAPLLAMGHPGFCSARQPTAWRCLSRSRTEARSATRRFFLPYQHPVRPLGDFGRQGMPRHPRWQGICRQGTWGILGVTWESHGAESQIQPSKHV